MEKYKGTAGPFPEQPFCTVNISVLNFYYSLFSIFLKLFDFVVVMNYFYHFNKLSQDEIACQHFLEKPKGVIEITSFTL